MYQLTVSLLRRCKDLMRIRNGVLHRKGKMRRKRLPFLFISINGATFHLLLWIFLRFPPRICPGPGSAYSYVINKLQIIILHRHKRCKIGFRHSLTWNSSDIQVENVIIMC
jgi:hypothetical protein